MKRCIFRILSVLVLCGLVSGFSLKSRAEKEESSENNDPVIIVTLGDSYSSGEGVLPFYGQDQEAEVKVRDNDWLAHRSTKSWSSLLEIPTSDGGSSGPIGQYREDPYQHKYESADPEHYQWYFAASSGATTQDFKKEQKKTVNRFYDGTYYNITDQTLPPQQDIFDHIDGTVDYVVFTMGGNDVGFANIITRCIAGSTNPDYSFFSVDEYITDKWEEFYEENGIRERIKQFYRDVAGKAPEAVLLAVGYPTLLYYGDDTLFGISEHEVNSVNQAVRKFNRELRKMTEECREEGISIEFVDVEEAFSGHEAYASDPWINPMIFPYQDEDREISVYSGYSMHPNEEGCRKYAECVNAKIAKIEREKYEDGRIRFFFSDSGPANRAGEQ